MIDYRLPHDAEAIAHYIVNLENKLTDENTLDNELIQHELADAYNDLQRVLG